MDAACRTVTAGKITILCHRISLKNGQNLWTNLLFPTMALRAGNNGPSSLPFPWWCHVCADHFERRGLLPTIDCGAVRVLKDSGKNFGGLFGL